MEISQLVSAQRGYFMSGKTRPIEFRLNALKKLQKSIEYNYAAISGALMQDLHKHEIETYMTEIGMVNEELRFHIKHLKKWARNQTVKTPLAQFPSKSFISPEPYGCVLIMAPWNYPVQLSLSPLIGAISAGNCAIVKPSSYTPKTSEIIEKILSDAFPVEYIATVQGGRAQNAELLEQRFDYIFFTGSVTVGKLVMEAASRHLTPVTLELGGKSPVIVDETADIPMAARRIAFGKSLNAGQTCVEPDYLFIHSSVVSRFIEEFKASMQEFFPNGDYSQLPHIVNDKHFERVLGLTEGLTPVFGGKHDAAERFIEPMLLTGVSAGSPIMQEEIFGPLLPMLEFTDISEPISYIRTHEKPLALYLFSSDKSRIKYVLDNCSFGGGCINDTIIHLATTHMPFGGVGYSGMGSYHGKKSFELFSHQRSIVKKATWLDLPFRYHPYTKKKLNIIKKFM